MVWYAGIRKVIAIFTTDLHDDDAPQFHANYYIDGKTVQILLSINIWVALVSKTCDYLSMHPYFTIHTFVNTWRHGIFNNPKVCLLRNTSQTYGQF